MRITVETRCGGCSQNYLDVRLPITEARMLVTSIRKDTAWAKEFRKVLEDRLGIEKKK